MESVDLKFFEGKAFYLTGVDTSTASHDRWGDGDRMEECQAISFTLDGVTYMAVEDPDDGYRSHLEAIRIVDGSKVVNRFPPCHVIAFRQPDDDYGKNDVIQFKDTTTGEVVLEIGTSNVDDYYPCYVGSFHPQAMAINQSYSVPPPKSSVSERPEEWASW